MVNDFLRLRLRFTMYVHRSLNRWKILSSSRGIIDLHPHDVFGEAHSERTVQVYSGEFFWGAFTPMFGLGLIRAATTDTHDDFVSGNVLMWVSQQLAASLAHKSSCSFQVR